MIKQRADRGGGIRSVIVQVQVSDEDGDGVFVVSDAFSSVYGAGPSPDAAIGDYVESLFDHLADLEAQEPVLGPALRQELTTLRRHLPTT